MKRGCSPVNHVPIKVWSEKKILPWKFRTNTRKKRGWGDKWRERLPAVPCSLWPRICDDRPTRRILHFLEPSFSKKNDSDMQISFWKAWPLPRISLEHEPVEFKKIPWHDDVASLYWRRAGVRVIFGYAKESLGCSAQLIFHLTKPERNDFLSSFSPRVHILKHPYMTLLFQPTF